MTRLSTRHRPRQTALVLAVAAVLAAAGVLPATAATVEASGTPQVDPADPEPGDSDAAERATFGIQPANTVAGNEQFAFDFSVAPGSRIFENVAVVNFAAEPVTLGLYGADAYTTTDGQFGLALRTDPATDAGSWITIGQPTTEVEVPEQTVALGAGRVFVPVAISVPPNAEPGDHAAGVVTSLTTLGENPEGQNVELEQRVALRVYVRVDGELVPALSINDLSATYRGAREPWRSGSLTVSGVVVNEGNIRLGYQPTVIVEGPFGLGRQVVTPDPILELLPRSRIEFSETVEGVWPLGAVRTTVELDPQAAPRVPDPGLEIVSASVWTSAVPWFLVILLILVTGVIVVLVVRRRRRQGGGASTEGGATPDPRQPLAGATAGSAR